MVDGVWSGVGSVVVFLPQILLLFLFIGILEDSGYLARAALIADRTMARFGLQGKSFIPLLSAYACAVPAIMATRTIENKRDRIATILIAPFMTCSARLPVYMLMIAAFIPTADGSRWRRCWGCTCSGFVAAILTARLLKSTVLKSGRSSFMLEMPPYRWPTLRSLGLRLVDRSKVFLRRAGTVILGVAVVIWVLAICRSTTASRPEIEHSFAGMIGHAVEPAIQPLGIQLEDRHRADHLAGGARGDRRHAGHDLRHGRNATSTREACSSALRHDLTPGGAAALLVFFAFAMQCMSTIAVVRRETGGWKWPAVQFAYMTFVAYTFALITNHVVSHFV